MTRQLSKELMRKLIHVSYTSFFAYLLILNSPYLIYYLLITLCWMLVYEHYRHTSFFIRQAVQRLGITYILRDHEHSAWTGATYVVIACVLCKMLFNPLTSMLSILILGLGDTAAALIGQNFGTSHKHGKSLIGSSAFFVTACCIVGYTGYVLKLPLIFYITSIFASIMAMCAERYSSRIDIDDNIAIPLVFGCIFYTLYPL